MIVPLISILKTTELPNKLAFGGNDSNDVVIRFGSDGKEPIKKSEKSKSQKMSKSQKLAKSGKNCQKSGNLPKFDAKEVGPSFLILDARMDFKCLRLTFTKAPILWHFDLKCYIWIKAYASGYAICGVLN